MPSVGASCSSAAVSMRKPANRAALRSFQQWRIPEGSGCLQVLINNAGMLERCTLEDVSEDAMISSYRVNCMGPLFTVQALLKQKLLHSGALIANVTSLVRCRLCSCALQP